MMRAMKRSAPVGVIVLLALAVLSGVPATRDASSAVSEGCANGRIVFTRERSIGPPPLLMTVEPNGSDLRTLGVGHAAKWSPNGGLLAFDNGRHILVEHPDGSGVHDITPGLHGVSSIDPAWSPDGRRLVFASEKAGTRSGALWIVRADGSGLRKLVDAPGEEANPSWSSSGREIVFDSHPARGPSHLYVVRDDGSGLRRITADTLDAWGPEWSSGNVIAFADGAGAPTSDIYTVRPDGSELRRLTHAPSGVSFGFPDISPDGKSLIVSRIVGRRGSIYRMTASGGQPTLVVASGQDTDVFADWGRC